MRPIRVHGELLGYVTTGATASNASAVPHDYSDSCPCEDCSRARRRQVETRTGQATDQGSR